jgi:hypothetical protein
MNDPNYPFPIDGWLILDGNDNITHFSGAPQDTPRFFDDVDALLDCVRIELNEGDSKEVRIISVQIVPKTERLLLKQKELK